MVSLLICVHYLMASSKSASTMDDKRQGKESNNVPRLARMQFRREFLAWLLLPVMLGMVEGGVAGVLANIAFADHVPRQWLNIAVALITGAPAFANVTSFLWNALSQGRHKIYFLVFLQVLAAVLVCSIGFAPTNVAGLILLTTCVVGSRMCWAGVVTLRSTVWRANYPRTTRATLAGKLVIGQTLVMAAVGILFGLALSHSPRSYHVLYPAAAMIGFIGAMVFRQLRMRGHHALLAAERSAMEQHGRRTKLANPLQILQTLREDQLFRRYMISMFIFGIGNLSVTAPLVIIVKDQFGYEYLGGILVTATIPILVMPFCIPLWSRLFDRMHIIHFRSIHCWSFISSTFALLLAALIGSEILLWLSAILRGVGFGGGVLGWNLGHHDFTTTEHASRYMGIHVTLTGIRGFIGPAAAVALYQWFNQMQDGAGGWVFAVCLFLNVTGAMCFFWLKRQIGAKEDMTITHGG